MHAIHYTDIFEHPLVPAFLVNGLLGMVIGSVVGLVEVVLAYDLIARDERSAFVSPRRRPPAIGRRRTTPRGTIIHVDTEGGDDGSGR